MTRPSGGSDYDYVFKVVLVGDSSVGKSNLLLRFTRDEFRIASQSTIGVEFSNKQVVVEGKKIRTQVWDTAGQERFKTVIPQFYRGSEGALAVFDLTNRDSFDHITSWVDEVHRHTPPDLPIVLVGNKSDLVDKRIVSIAQATELAKVLNVSYLETSALNASNVEVAFTTLVTHIYYRKIPKTIECTSTSNGDNQETSNVQSVTQEPKVHIGQIPETFRLKDDRKGSTVKKDRCC